MPTGLDAMGAIGIARAFAYGGAKGRAIYDPAVQPTEHRTAEAYLKSGGHTINHFYEKLLLLKDRMNTATGRAVAEERHRFMEDYLRRFYEEWEGGCLKTVRWAITVQETKKPAQLRRASVGRGGTPTSATCCPCLYRASGETRCVGPPSSLIDQPLSL